jgi:hypothetical protein
MIKVLYLMGWGRSGTTLVDNALGEIDGFFSAGELHYLWERGMLERRLCGCGTPVPECPVWAEILRRLESSAPIDARGLIDSQRRALRVRHTWRLTRGGTSRVDRSYLDITGLLYRSIAEVTGARVIVDSSKRPSDGALLRFLPGIQPFFLHMVRDPRAVAHSWRRIKDQPDRGSGATMVRHGVAASTASWVAWNLAAEAVRKTAFSRSVLVRYEDLVSDPVQTLQKITAFVDEPTGILPLADGAIELTGNHTVSGNPSRFKIGKVPIRRDDEWRRSQSRLDRSTATVVALPLLRRYGYPVAVT